MPFRSTDSVRQKLTKCEAKERTLDERIKKRRDYISKLESQVKALEGIKHALNCGIQRKNLDKLESGGFEGYAKVGGKMCLKKGKGYYKPEFKEDGTPTFDPCG